MKLNHQIATPNIPDAAKLEREVPVASIGTAAIVFLLSLGSGAVVFIGVGLIAWAGGWSWRLPLASAGGAILVVWGWWLFSKTEPLLWAIETITGKDWNQDGHTGNPTISVEVHNPEHNQYRYIDWPGTPEQLQKLVYGTLSGRTLSESEWTGKGQPYTKREFKQLRAELLERGLVTWRNEKHPQQGVELTVFGRTVFREIIRTYAHAGTGHQLTSPNSGVG